jgi:HK97 family phage major capsid protein
MSSNFLNQNEFWKRLKNFPGGIVGFQHLRHNRYDSYFLPEDSDRKFRAALKKESLFRNIGTVLPGPKGDASIFVSNDTDEVEWITPTTNLQEHTDAFNKTKLPAHVLSVITKIDDDTVHDAQFDLEAHLIKRFAKSFAEGEENAFLNGDGDYKPYGILNDTSGAEIGHSTAAIGYEDVVRLYFSVKKEYRKNGCWLMNDVTAFTLRKLQDNGGSYIWNQNNNTILGKPVYISYSMPDPEQGKKPIAFGDFSHFWIVDRLPLAIRELNEIYTLYGHIGFLGHEYLNGILITPEAIKVLKLI